MTTFSAELFLSLAAAHFAGDFLLQSHRDVLNKRQPLCFGKHVVIIAVSAYVFVGSWTAWFIPLVIGLSHALIDAIKLWADSRGWRGAWPYLLDQAAHLGLIVAVAAHWHELPVGWALLLGLPYFQFCLVLSGLLVAVYFGGYLIGYLVEPYYLEIRPKSEAVILSQDPASEGLARGGLVIGQLERALIYFFVLVGQPEAVAFLVAAKSVFRFGELSKSRKEAEYILIGTLMSFAWGLVAAWVTTWALRQMS